MRTCWIADGFTHIYAVGFFLYCIMINPNTHQTKILTSATELQTWERDLLSNFSFQKRAFQMRLKKWAKNLFTGSFFSRSDFSLLLFIFHSKKSFGEIFFVPPLEFLPHKSWPSLGFGSFLVSIWESGEICLAWIWDDRSFSSHGHGSFCVTPKKFGQN